MVSVLGTNTLNVAQFPSIFSTLNTVEHVSVIPSPPQLTVESLLTGILHGVPFPQQVYKHTGLVLHIKQLGPPPSIGLSQVSKQLSGQAFSCKTKITFKISQMQFPELLELLFIFNTLSCIFTNNL